MGGFQVRITPAGRSQAPSSTDPITRMITPIASPPTAASDSTFHGVASQRQGGIARADRPIGRAGACARRLAPRAPAPLGRGRAGSPRDRRGSRGLASRHLGPRRPTAAGAGSASHPHADAATARGQRAGRCRGPKRRARGRRSHPRCAADRAIAEDASDPARLIVRKRSPQAEGGSACRAALLESLATLGHAELRHDAP